MKIKHSIGYLFVLVFLLFSSVKGAQDNVDNDQNAPRQAIVCHLVSAAFCTIQALSLENPELVKGFSTTAAVLHLVSATSIFAQNSVVDYVSPMAFLADWCSFAALLTSVRPLDHGNILQGGKLWQYKFQAAFCGCMEMFSSLMAQGFVSGIEEKNSSSPA